MYIINEILVRERIQDLHREAEQHRIVRAAVAQRRWRRVERVARSVQESSARRARLAADANEAWA